MRWLLRVAVAATTLVLGATIALFVVALHGYGWGLALGLVTTVACVVALPGGWARMPFGIGWAFFTFLATQTRPEGDFVITQDAVGWTLLGSAVVVLVLSMIGAREAPPITAEAPDITAEAPDITAETY